jgi:hypothetical protein
VSFPTPVPGLVIRYSFLWREAAARGEEEGGKDRPCAVVLVSEDQNGEKVVLVLPMTHSPPAEPDLAVEIPIETKRRLGLDDQRSWIIVTDANRFVWPGPRSEARRPRRRIVGRLRSIAARPLLRSAREIRPRH